MVFKVLCNISRNLIRHSEALKLCQGRLSNWVNTVLHIDVISGISINQQSAAEQGIVFEPGRNRYRRESDERMRQQNDDEKETPEDKLINTIKRSILCIQREQYDKAEQMLHLALRMAQEIQSKDGITYVYDIMANLAMEREQFRKAEKLFADIMKRLFADGHTDESPQILHISAKLAHMAQLQGDLDKSLNGFLWTIKKIEEYLSKIPDDKDVQELFGLTKNWFGQLQIKRGKYADAKKYFLEAYDCLIKIYGAVNAESVTILNNLSIACVNLEEYDEAKRHLMHALHVVNELKDTTQEAVLQANLGMVHLREGLIAQAKQMCSLAWRNAKKSKNADAIEQAEFCLDEIKSHEEHRHV